MSPRIRLTALDPRRIRNPGQARWVMFEETRAMELELYAALITHDEPEADRNTSEGETPEHQPLTRALTLELVAD
jgi:hypothetical protein